MPKAALLLKKNAKEPPLSSTGELGVNCMYGITLVCKCLSNQAGEDAAVNIIQEFKENRQWHENVMCSWNGSELKLVAENDFDTDGQALLDEFSDFISACVIDYFDSKIEIESVNEFKY